LRFGAEHSPSPDSGNLHESARINGETQLNIVVPLGTDLRNILLYKIGSYITAVMKALAKIMEPLQDEDGSSTNIDIHVNTELNEPQDHVTIAQRHPKENMHHNLWAGEPWPQTRISYPIFEKLEHISELSHATLTQQTFQSNSYPNYPQSLQEIPQTSYLTESLNHVSGTENIVGPSDHGMRPGYVRTTNDGLLSGKEDVLQFDLSLPDTQLDPVSHYSLQQPHVAQSVDRSENGGLFPGTGDVSAGNDCISPENGIIPEIVGSVIGGVLSGTGNTAGQIVFEVPRGDNGADGDGLLPGNGNTLEFDLSLPTTHLNPLLYDSVQQHQSALRGNKFTRNHASRDSGRPEINGLFQGIGNIYESRNSGILSGNRDNAQQAISDGFPETDSLVAARVNVGNGNIESPGEGDVTPTSLNGSGKVGGDLLTISGAVLLSGLSLPATQHTPTVYRTMGHATVVPPIHRGIRTDASGNRRLLPKVEGKSIPEYSSFLNGIGNIANSVTRSLLHGNGNIVIQENNSPFSETEHISGTVADDLLPELVKSVEPESIRIYSGTGNIVRQPSGNMESFKEPPLAVAGNSQFAPTSKSFSASHNAVLSPSLSVSHLANSKEIDYGSSIYTGGLDPGTGNIPHLDLSLPALQNLLLSHSPRKFTSDPYPIEKIIHTPKVSDDNLLTNSDPHQLSGLQHIEPNNSNTLPGTGSNIYAPSVSGTFHSLPGQETLVIPAASLSPTQTNGGAELAIEPCSFLPCHSVAAYSIADDRPIGTQSLGRNDDISMDVHNHFFQFWPTIHTVRTVDSKEPVASSENFHPQSVSQLEISKLPLSFTESNEALASTSDKFKIAEVENSETTKIPPFNGISQAEILYSNALLDALTLSEALNQVPHVDHSLKHIIVSIPKYRNDEYQMYRPENDLSLKHLHYKHVPSNKDRSWEALDESQEATQANTANGAGMGDRIATRDAGPPYYDRIHNLKNEQNDNDMTEPEHDIDINVPNKLIPKDEIMCLAKKGLNKNMSRVGNKICAYSVPGKREEYFQNEALLKQPREEYAPEKNRKLSFVSSVIEERTGMQDSVTEKQISFHEPKILRKNEDITYSDFSSFKENEKILLNVKITDQRDPYFLPMSREKSPRDNMVRHSSNNDPVEKSKSDSRNDDTNMADLALIIDTYPNENSSGRSKLSIDEAQEKRKSRMQSQDKYQNANYEPADSSVSYTSGSAVTAPLTPLLPSFKPQDTKYYEIPHSNILIPQHSADIDASTYGEMTSLPNYIRALNDEQNVSSLIQNGSYATSIAYVSELWDKGGSENVPTRHRVAIVSGPALTSFSETGNDEDSAWYSDNLYSPNWERVPSDNVESTEAEESLLSSLYQEIKAYGVEPQTIPAQKSNSVLEAQSHYFRERSHLANNHHEFQANPAYSHKVQPQQQRPDQEQTPYLSQDGQSDLLLRSKKYDPHSTSKHHKEREPHSHLLEQKQDFESTSVHGRQEGRPNSPRNDVGPDLRRQNFHLEPRCQPTHKEIRPHSYVSENNHVSYSVSAPQETESQTFSLHHGFKPHAYLSNHPLEPRSATSQIQHHSYISENDIENDSLFISPYLEHKPIRMSSDQREPYSYQHALLPTSSGTHKFEPHFDLFSPSLTREVQSHQEVDSYLANNAGSLLSHEMKAYLPDHLHAQTSSFNAVDANSHSYTKDKKHRSLCHVLEPKSQEIYADSRIKLQKVAEELRPNNEASSQHEHKAFSIQNFVPLHMENSIAKANKEFPYPRSSHAEQYSHFEANPPTPSDFSSVNAVTFTDYELEPHIVTIRYFASETYTSQYCSARKWTLRFVSP
jgi:hypothetical protein